ncbi:AAA family ATPase [Kineosporia babensis]|uniref:AAA family ATPase n=1 Tax=Kineosporia babensis TaxID=499548 RepID=A0A9X1NHG0_9ACTN|nr:AAA family ATPase [Kineosporia babensis]MCD5314040.1 AAA family ATPase [Kineosporia babensis]
MPQKFWIGLQWERPSTPEHPNARRPALSMKLAPSESSLHFVQNGPWTDNPRGWFVAGYGPFRRLAGGGVESQRLMTAPAPVARLVTLFHEDASVSESVSWLIDQHLRSLEGRPGAEALLDAVLKIMGHGLLPDGYIIERVDADGLWVAREGQRLALREMSDGYRTVASLVLDILHQIHEAQGTLQVSHDEEGAPYVDAPGVVLIDELDAHLHISWQKIVGDWLKTHFPAIQFIVSSHSPYICQSADPRGLIRLGGPNDQTPPTTVSDDLYSLVIYGSGDDAAISDLFDVDTPYSRRAEEARRRLVQLEQRIVDGQASEVEVGEYDDLLRRTTSSLLSRVEEVATRLAE